MKLSDQVSQSQLCTRRLEAGFTTQDGFFVKCWCFFEAEPDQTMNLDWCVCVLEGKRERELSLVLKRELSNKRGNVLCLYNAQIQTRKRMRPVAQLILFVFITLLDVTRFRGR